MAEKWHALSVEEEAGNVIPADVRLAETANLKVDEASLTGEAGCFGKPQAGPRGLTFRRFRLKF